MWLRRGNCVCFCETRPFFKHRDMSRRQYGIQTQLTFLYCITWCGGHEAMCLLLWNSNFLWTKRHEQTSQRDPNTSYICVLRHQMWRRRGNVSASVNLEISLNIVAWADVTTGCRHSLHLYTTSADVEETRQCVCFCEPPDLIKYIGMSRRHNMIETQLTFL